MRIVLRVAEVGVQSLDLLGGQRVLGVFRGVVQAGHGHVGVVGEMALPEPVRPDHGQGSTLPSRSQGDSRHSATNPASRLQTVCQAQGRGGG